MISAMSSGSGKTTVTCALLRVLVKRGIKAEGFKCGPDYIDPMFQRRVLGIPSHNLDIFLQGEENVIRTLDGQTGEIGVIEGAMGFYDGIGGTEEGSAWHISAPAAVQMQRSGSISEPLKMILTSITAKMHLSISTATVIAPAFTPITRSAFVVPAFPLPFVRISMPCILPRIYDVWIMPKTYPITNTNNRTIIISYCFSVRSLVIKWIGVPRKPKASRIWFSI